MKTFFTLIIALMVISFACFVTLKEQQNNFLQDSLTGKRVNFNFVFKYESKNELNTINQTFTKDMVLGPPVTTKMKLSNSELKDIYKKINALGLLNDGAEPNTKSKNFLNNDPCTNYYLKVQIDSEQKELSWDNCRGKIINNNFQQFSDYIIQIIESKKEYKDLPSIEGGYL